MNYIELHLTVSPDYADIFTAELAELGFESFVETDDGLNAYIAEPGFEERVVRELVAKYRRSNRNSLRSQFVRKEELERRVGERIRAD